MFDKAANISALANKSSNEIGGEIESRQYHAQDIIHEKRFIPRVDYSNPRNFARYGSAEEYYSRSIERVLNTYPYDGSLKERLQWENESAYLDLYILDNLYPRTNGYILLSEAGWGTRNGSESGDGYGLPNNLEYIYLEGGPHGNPTGPTPYPQQFTGSNYYDPGTNRESNLKFDLKNQGATIEFWLKKDAWASLTTKEVLFDMEASDTGIEKNRFRLALDSSGDGASPFLVTALSGGTGFTDTSLGSSVTIADGLWHHYAVTLKSVPSGIETRLYIDGGLNVSSVLGSSVINEVTGALIATVGALVATTAGGGAQYAGKLSGSLDELRYWKTRRSGKQVGRYWFDQVGGGTNTDPEPFTDTQEEVNTTLGVYYKFNEGITGDTSIDNVVLDYSGRVSNGSWAGYTTTSRNTGSAIVLSNAAIKEFKDPIIYASNPEVVMVRASLAVTGSDHDVENAAMVYKSIPGWITEEDEETTGDLKKLTQIMGSYFDTLQLQTDSLNKLKDVQYVSGSNKPLPFADRLLNSHGLVSPEIFLDADILEKLADRSEDKLYEKSLNDLKNIIYQNIYNNLTYIYKSKGTEKSFRNLIRCFGVDDELIKLKLYAKNTGYEFRENRRSIIVPNKYVNFNTFDSTRATVFSYKDPSGSNANSYGYLTSSVSIADGWPYTLETDVFFPTKMGITNAAYVDTNTLTASLFGIHGTIGSETDTSWPQVAGTVVDDKVNFQVFAIRDEKDSPNVRFVLTGTEGGYVPRLESDLYENVYSDVAWNLSVRVKPERYPLTDFAYLADTTNYIIELHGIKVQSGEYLESFTLSDTITAPPEGFITGSKRVFVGAHRTNFTGAVLQTSDVKVEACRFWLNYVENEALRAHALDSENHGALQPHKYAYPFLNSGSYGDVVKFDTLAFNWEFSENTGSNALGQFVVADESSGSADQLAYYNGLGELLNKQYTALGYNFAASSTDPIIKDFAVISRLNDIETIAPSEQVNVLSQQDQQVFKIDSRPINYFFSFEKSMYNTITEEMVNYFGTLKDFNTLIGAPVNRYRTDYKSLAFLKQKFFEKVGNSEIDFDKFYELYKWFDSSLSFLLAQLVPASADFAQNIRTMVESHALERNKYRNILPFLDSEKTVFETALSSNVDYGDAISSPDDDAQGTGFYPVHAPRKRIDGLTARGTVKKWKYMHAPADASEKEKYLWWKNEAERDTPEISVPADVLISRTQILQNIKSANNRQNGTPYRFNVAGSYALRGVGTNYNLRPNLLYPAIAPFGKNAPGTNALENIAFISGSTVEELLDTTDEFFPNYRQRLGFEINLSKNKTTGPEIASQGLHAAPFSLYKSDLPNVPAAFRADGRITNLHHDFVADNAIPLQGPFTEQQVGGRQFRHVALNQGADTAATRPEGFKLEFSEVSSSAGGKFSGSLVIVPPNYTGQSGEPATGLLVDVNMPTAQRFRDETAKRPVNIKNIFMSTASVGTRLNNISTHGKIGNYDKNYQVIQTSGRSQNDPYFVEQSFAFALNPETTATRGRFLGILNDDSTANTGGTLNYTLPTRTGLNSNQTIFVNRFSAPGGYEVNSLGYMDPAHEELSVYNALPYRNRGVIDYGLSGSASADPSIAQAEHVVGQLLHARGLNQRASLHSAEFGIDAAYGSITNTSTRVDGGLGYSETPSWQKTNRNRLRRMEENETGYFTGSVYDNLFVQHQIPQSTQQYSWVTASIAPNQRFWGLQAPTCISASSLSELMSGSMNIVAGAAARGENEAAVYIPLREIIVDPVSASSHILGYPLDAEMPGKGALATPYLNTKMDATLGGGTVIDNDLPNTLVLNRNGPYQYPAWKQTRTGEHPVARKLRETNKIGTVRVPPLIPDFVGVTKQRKGYVRAKQPTAFVDFTEQPLSSRHYPTYIAVEDNTATSDVRNNIALEVTYGNKLDYFSNEGFNNLLNIPAPNLYNNAFTNIVENVLSSDWTAMINYSERIYPAEVNAYKNIVRNRTTFSIGNIWSSSRKERSDTTVVNSQGHSIPDQSVWPLDANLDFSTEAPLLTDRNDGSGELQNMYNRFGTAGGDDVTASVLYASRIPVGFNGTTPVYGGVADWSAGSQAKKAPYERYEDWVYEMRLSGKDYSIVPEFRISEILSTYLDTHKGDFLADVNGIFTLTGSSSEISTTSEEFFRTYTNADFMKYFKVVDDLVDQQRSGGLKITRDKVSLRCAAFLKFLPYKGFYPAERIVELGTLFSQSYGDFVETHSTKADASTGTNQTAYRTIVEPLFAPGIWNNTVKSGVAVGSWVTTSEDISSIDISRSGQGVDSGENVFPDTNGTTICFGSGSLLSGAIDRTQNQYNFDRIPFEAVYRPEEFFNDKTITGSYFYDTGVATASLAYINGNVDTLNKVRWSGGGKKLYRLAADNFLCETSNFFMDKNVSFVSSPENQFGEKVSEGEKFALTLNFNRTLTRQGTKADLTKFEMYDRPSAYGPPFVLDDGTDIAYAGVAATGSIVLTSSLLTPGVKAAGFVELTGAYIGGVKATGSLKVVSWADNVAGQMFRFYDGLGVALYTYTFTAGSTTATTVNVGSSDSSQAANIRTAINESDFVKVSGAVCNIHATLNYVVEITQSVTGTAGNNAIGENGGGLDVIDDSIAGGTNGTTFTLTAGDRYILSDGGTGGDNFLQPGTINSAVFSMTASGAGSCEGDACFEFVNTGDLQADMGATLDSFKDTVNTYQAANPSFKLTATSYATEDGTGNGIIYFQNANTGSFGNVAITSVTGTNGWGYQVSGGMGSAVADMAGDTAGSDPIYTLTDQDRFAINDGGCDGSGNQITFYLTGAVSGSAAWDAAATTTPFAELTASNASSSAMQLMDAINAVALYGTFPITASLDETVTPSATSARINIVNGYEGTCGNQAITKTINAVGNTYIHVSGCAGGVDSYTASEYTASLAPNLPSYYYGTSSVTILTTASYSGQQTIGELFAAAEFIYDRSYESGKFDTTALGYWFAQQVSESINLNEVFLDPEADHARWAIQTKFETPVFNFAGVSQPDPASANTRMKPNCDLEVASKGMWHQYGSSPGDDEGIFVSITTPNLVVSPTYGRVTNPKSLAQMVGFQEGVKKKIGKLKESQTLEEAVVIVPFLVRRNRRKFLKFPKRRPASYHKLVHAMQKYIFPPKFDFLQFRTVLPAMMYVFEFKLDLTREDIGDIWQNLPPGKVPPKFEMDEIVIDDKNLINKILEDNEELQWLVFKVKKRATRDFEIQRRLQLTPSVQDIQPSAERYSYNWPYDYFSLVELIKIDETVQYVSSDAILADPCPPDASEASNLPPTSYAPTLGMPVLGPNMTTGIVTAPIPEGLPTRGALGASYEVAGAPAQQPTMQISVAQPYIQTTTVDPDQVLSQQRNAGTTQKVASTKNPTVVIKKNTNKR